MLALVTAQAAGIHFFSRGFGWIEDLACIPAAIGVGLSCTVAVFARYSARAMRRGQSAMGVIRKLFGDFLMTRCADSCSRAL